MIRRFLDWLRPRRRVAPGEWTATGKVGYAIGVTGHGTLPSVTKSGTVWVTAAEDITDVTNVIALPDGRFGCGNPGPSRPQIPNAHYGGTVKAGELVRLSIYAPSLDMEPIPESDSDEHGL